MKRISWKRGMRLSDSILRASDESMAEIVTRAFVLAAAGRFGLLPSQRPFELSLNIDKGFLDIESLFCLAVTKDGDLIDAHYDTSYNNNFDTRIPMPDIPDADEYILTINAERGQWKDVPEGFEEPVYTFSLYQPDTTIPSNAVPIGRIVEDHGWRMDEADFVPPCLFVASHWKFEELRIRFADVLSTIDTKARAALTVGNREVVALFWPLIQQLRIAADKEHELMTPMMLLSNVQKCVSAFTCAADLHDALDVTDAKMYHSYVLAPCTYKEAYQRIKVGLDICFAISEKVQKLAELSSQKPQAESQRTSSPLPEPPVLVDAFETQICSSPTTEMRVDYMNRTAKIFFTIDGSEPTQHSLKAIKSPSGFKIEFDNGYKGGAAEPEKGIVVKLVAFVGGVSSDVVSYDVTLQKSRKFGKYTEI